MVPQTASGPLHCTSPADVYLLLKSSDLVSHGLDHARAYEPALSPFTMVPVELVLRKYIPINPSMEFRCFVRNNLLIGQSGGTAGHAGLMTRCFAAGWKLLSSFARGGLAG